MLRYATLFIVICVIGVPAALAEPVDFDRSVASILATRCLECHNEADKKGKLDLSTKLSALRDKDPVIVPGDAGGSLLWEMVDGDEMPPKKALPAAEKAILKRWIEEGAKWGTPAKLDRFAFSSESHAGADWWSLQPVKRPGLPAVKDKQWPANPIDFFVLSKLEARNLSPAPPADPRVLIRRVYFDLIGLPPSPAEVEAFVKEWNQEVQRPASGVRSQRQPAGPVTDGKDSGLGTADSGPSSVYARLIDRLLASPHYGERWARHWLDVARYTESQGFEYDRFRPNAWHYRDYVINAFNSDKPYNLFLQEQIAGDVKNFESPEAGVTSQGMIATSLLVCGPWDQAGSSQANVTQRMITREEEMEDLVSVIGQTFLGMTINCARCHSHKFDPITHADYFSFKAVFEGVRHGERSIATPNEARRRSETLAALQKEIDGLQQQVATIERQARSKVLEKLPVASEVKSRAAVAPIARWTFEGDGQDVREVRDVRDVIGAMHGELIGGAVVREGRLIVSGRNQFLRTGPLKQDIREKTLESWVYLPTLEQGGGGILTLESGNGVTFDSIVFGERQQRKWIAGSTNFQRTRDLNAEPETATPAQIIHMAITYRADGTITLYRNGKRYADAYRQHELQTYKAGDGRVLIGLRHTGAGNGFLNGQIESASLYDRVLSDEELAASFAAGAGGGPVVTREQMVAVMTDMQRKDYEAGIQRIATLERERSALPPVAGVSYIGTRRQSAPTRRLNRGDVNSPAEVVMPAGLSIIKKPSFDLGLAADAPEAERRIKLAQWLADPQHPLTARVMVNRLWHHHFGRGIVETPNDFGFSGGKPSHPELLDWLAAEFVEGRDEGTEARRHEGGETGGGEEGATKGAWSIKRMHRLILLSATYQQSATMNETAAAIDADNALLWRYSPRRVEGEIIRDAMLTVSGELNRQLGGPSFKPFTVTNHGSDFYHLKDMIGAEYNRRTIYRANINSGKSAMMDALDCPDPSIKTPARRVTTTPLAALALMNNSFVQRQAAKMAQRMVTEAGADENRGIVLAYQTAFGRSPQERELKDAAALVKEHGLETLCWALLNASEFMYVK